MVHQQLFYSTFLVFQTLKSKSAFTLTYTDGRAIACKVPTCSSGTHTHTPMEEKFGVQYLASWHVDMQTGEVRDWATNLLISRWSALHPEPQPHKPSHPVHPNEQRSLSITSGTLKVIRYLFLRNRYVQLCDHNVMATHNRHKLELK